MNTLYEAPLLKAFFSTYNKQQYIYIKMKKAGVTDKKLTEILNMDLGEYTLLHSLTDNDIEIVDFLLENNFDFEKPNGNKQTPLHMASVNNCTVIVQRLIERKAKVDALDITDNTPLHFACYFSRENVIKILIEYNANPEAINKDKQQPLDMSPPKIQQLLLKIEKKIPSNCLLNL